MESLEPGAVFGPYTIEGLVASGGMGQVYAARHEVYGSVVALKVLHGNLDQQADWRKRFQEEGLVGTQLKHPSVLSAREVVEHEGKAAIVMDLVKGGQTLEKCIGREFPNGLSLVQGLQLFLSIIQGIDYLHGKGVLHGDLKPENVLIDGEYRRPETWSALITDFGTVGLIAHPVVIDGRTAVVATPRYASPEHLRGVDKIEVRSDVYCLGLLLHHLLSGKHCSDARTVREAAAFVMTEVPLVNLVDQPEALQAVFRKATQVKAVNRYANCRDLALGIREVLDGLGVKLDLQDVQADLATEVDEERSEAQRKLTEAAEREPDEFEIDPNPDAPTELDPVPVPRVEPGNFDKGSKSEVTLEPDNVPSIADESPSMPGEQIDEPTDDIELNTGMEEQPEPEPETDDIELNTGMEAQLDESYTPEKTSTAPRLSSDPVSTPAPVPMAVAIPFVVVGFLVLGVLGLITLFVL